MDRYLYEVGYRYGSPVFAIHLIVKETEKIYKVRPHERVLGYPDISRQAYKDNPYLFLDVGKALEFLSELNLKHIRTLEEKRSEAHDDTETIRKLKEKYVHD